MLLTSQVTSDILIIWGVGKKRTGRMPLMYSRPRNPTSYKSYNSLAYPITVLFHNLHTGSSSMELSSPGDIDCMREDKVLINLATNT